MNRNAVRKEYVVVSLLSKNAPRSFERTDWPLHVTIVRPFFSDKAPKELVRVLRAACARHKVFHVSGKSRGMFGPNHDIAVTELERGDALQSLHSDALQALEGSATFIGPDFNEYRPHVTDHKSGNVAVGEKVLIHSVSLVAMGEGERRILHTIAL